MKKARYIEVIVGHYLLFMLSPPKISWTVLRIKSICLHVLIIFYLTQPSSKQIICFDFKKQDSALPYNILYTLLISVLCLNEKLLPPTRKKSRIRVFNCLKASKFGKTHVPYGNLGLIYLLLKYILFHAISQNLRYVQF